MTERLPALGAGEIHRLFAAGEVSAREIVEACLERIGAVDKDVRAFLRTVPEGALDRARALDEARAGGEPLGPLAGVPVAVKDNLATTGVETTAGSRILEGWIPPYTATAVARLEAAGAIVIGKTNLDEFAMGSSTENSAFHPTMNPHDLGRVPGGSSGGSAAAVAAQEVPVALGSDTGGSVRQPAAYCGVFGLKPTYGRISRYGLVAFASSLDQVGPLGRTVEDVGLLLAVMSGEDRSDATSAPEPPPDAEVRADVRGLTFAVPEVFLDGAEAPLREATRRAADALRQAGAEEREVRLPNLDQALAAYYVISPAEASSNLARFDGIRYGARVPDDDLIAVYRRSRGRGFGPEVKRRIIVGTYVLSAGYYDAYYLKAQGVRALIRRDLARAFEEVDLILTPTTPTAAFPFGAHSEDPLTMYAQDVMTVPANLAGNPALSVPAGTSEGLPLGVQIYGRPFDEPLLLRAGAALEAALERPSLGGERGVAPCA